MSMQAPTSDAELLTLLRVAGQLSILELAHAMEVTATAVRRHLPRLLGQKVIQRESIRHGRGRPRDLYSLTEEGLRRTDSPFTEVALTVWKEIRQSSDPELRRDTLRRIARASGEADKIRGETPAERTKSLAKLLNQQQIPVSVRKAVAAVPPNEPAATPTATTKPNRGITSEQIEAACRMIKAIGGFGRLHEVLVVIKEVGGVTKLKVWLDTMDVDEPNNGM